MPCLSERWLSWDIIVSIFELLIDKPNLLKTSSSSVVAFWRLAWSIMESPWKYGSSTQSQIMTSHVESLFSWDFSATDVVLVFEEWDTFNLCTFFHICSRNEVDEQVEEKQAFWATLPNTRCCSVVVVVNVNEVSSYVKEVFLSISKSFGFSPSGNLSQMESNSHLQTDCKSWKNGTSHLAVHF